MREDRIKKRFRDNFFTLFNTNHMILFVGDRADDSVLTAELCSLKWSCVITSCTDVKFADRFMLNGRRVNQPKNVSEISRTPFNRDELPIFRLMGIDGDCEDDDKIEDYGFEDDKMERARGFLSKLPGMLEYLNHMYIVGYGDSETSYNLWNQLGKQLLKIPNGNVSFFGIKNGETARTVNIRHLAEDKDFDVFEEELADIIKDLDHKDDFNTPEYTPDSDVNRFYKNGNVVTIDGDELTRTRNFASLLTDNLIYSYRPYGKNNLKTAFANFLDDSASEGPQWYGYLQNSDFHLKRPFENPLIYLVNNAIDGYAPDGKYSFQKPIILEGDPGSSKSITLASLAYHIYNKHKNPVIFIKDPMLSLNRNSVEFNDLVSLMEEIDDIDVGNRILIIWDCSSHLRVHEAARQLAKDLNDIGRKFVLVCSAYNNENGDGYDYGWNAENKSEPIFRLSDSEEGVITVADGCYIVHAVCELTLEEIKKLKGKFNEYANIDYNAFCWTKLEENGDNEIFTYFYNLINLIRPKLEYGLTREHNAVAEFVNEKLNKVKLTYNNKSDDSEMLQAFKRAGIDLSEYGLSEADIDSGNNDVSDLYDLETFNICIALFSLFKLSTPVRLALNMLCRNKDANILYSDGGRNMFNEITKSLPWISYGSNGEDYAFKFRTSLEAQIYLRNNSTAERQLDIICDIIDYYIDYYQINAYIDVDFARNLQTFLRKIGPNSDDQELFDEYDYVFKNLDRIISGLRELRICNVPDEDAGFASIEITFLREYYVNILNKKTEDNDNITAEFYEERLRRMRDAVRLATEADDKLAKRLRFMTSNYDGYGYSKKHLSNQRMQLAVELTHCNIEAEKIREKYIEFCSKKHCQINSNWGKSMFILPYRDTFQRLEKAINQDPTSSYTYNALFKLFMEEYMRQGMSEDDKLKYLTEITAIIDNMDLNGVIYTRGKKSGEDELSSRISEIMSWASKKQITIEDMINRNPSIQNFIALYDRMLDEGNASAIMLVCRQEQIRAGIISNNFTQKNENMDLTAEQREACKNIKDFMEKTENLNCIKSNAYAINLLFKITWMLYEGKRFSVQRECQLTHLTTEQWSDIKRICEYYIQTRCENPLPSIYLIYALSMLQLTGDYQKCYTILKEIGEDNFYSMSRMRVPFMYCNSDGSVKKFAGSVSNTDGNTGFVILDGVPRNFGRDVGIRFNKGSIGERQMPRRNERLLDLEIGIRYTGFALYTEKGRKRRSENYV